ncbi:hypothetical protein LRK24_10210 [Rhodanobacter denitrificans]|uniref:hypothetical protein n=1 Tax=Rhodanobacter denitrificans TaxID=666685 RepID=UPI000260FED4|nr:hypothetical protein [Rhodanobacter denitrificans]EIM04114.1 hypothetical protein UUC_02800 [Rhodanobacter denitrificans]UJM88835.1 hypothetical protein LRK24_10210 [Rhodanobacter denitrificans]
MGWLSSTPEEEDYRIAAMPGTTQVPGPGAWEGSLTAIPKGVTSAGEKIADFMSLLGGALDPLGADQARLADGGTTGVYGTPLQQPAGTFGAPTEWGSFQPQGSIKEASAAARIVSDWAATGQDPRKTGALGRILDQTAEGLTIATAGAAAGPWGAAGLLGSTLGYSSYLEGKQAGLDDGTALEQAGITGVFSAAGAFVPMKFGKTLAQSVLGGGAVNVALGGAQRFAASTILNANGYADMAKQYRVFDGEAMAADAILGHAFGALGHVMHGGTRPDPAAIDAAAAVSAEEHFNRSAPGVPIAPNVANAHADTMAQALHALSEGDLPTIPPEKAQKLVDGVLPDPVHALAPEVEAAARAELPGYDAAAASIPVRELPAETSPEPVAPIATAPGESRPIPLDDFHGDLLAHLVHNYGDAPYITEDGRQVSFRQMANELQLQRSEADSFAKLHDIAAACAARNGA